jgi:monoamine oxidase
MPLGGHIALMTRKFRRDVLQFGSLPLDRFNESLSIALCAVLILQSLAFAAPQRTNFLHTMRRNPISRLTRRSFLTGSGALAAGSAFGQRARPAAQPGSSSSEVDCLIIGAGAAGIAAARRLAAAGKSFRLIEASNRIGGRCVTDTQSFGVPFDRGAHFIYNAKSNPISQLAPRTGLDVYPAPVGQLIRINRRNARESELEDFLAATARVTRAFADTARGRADSDGARMLPHDLGDWQSTVEFMLGPYANGRDLSALSAMELARAPERENAALCRQGYGALLAKLAESIPVQLNTEVKLVDVVGRGAGVELATSRGPIGGRFVIVTASTNVLAEQRIKFGGGLMSRHQDAVNKLRLGTFEHIALELPGNPLELQRDEVVFEKSSGPRTAALIANVRGGALSVVEICGRFGRDLAQQGDKAMVEFAVEWLSGLFGPAVKKALKRTQTTQWLNEPFILGSFAAASPGGLGARQALMEPMRGNVYFAGEAVHDTAWGTVGGAWDSGSRAAEAVLRRLAGQPAPTPPEIAVEAKPRSKRRKGRH